MLYQIVSLLLEVATSVLAGACLLRLYMQHQRIPMSVRSGNPLGRFVFALTDWLVLPLRRRAQLVWRGILFLDCGGSSGLMISIRAIRLISRVSELFVTWCP